MKHFKHIDACTVEEASAALQEGNAVAIAGGTDLLGALKDKILLTYPETVVNIKTIPGMDGIEETKSGVRIGANAKLTAIAESELVKEKCPSVAEAAYSVASPLIRNQATIGGNISTNAGGMRAVKYGVTRDYVRSLTVVLPNAKSRPSVLLWQKTVPATV